MINLPGETIGYRMTVLPEKPPGKWRVTGELAWFGDGKTHPVLAQQYREKKSTKCVWVALPVYVKGT